MLEKWRNDLTYAARSLVRTPGFALAVVATLALTIGANTTIFSVVHAVLLEPLPYPNAERLIHIGGTAPGTDRPAEFGVPDELFLEYRQHASALEDIGLYEVDSPSTSRVDGQVDQLFKCDATPSLFSTLGVQPQRGRLPTETDDDTVVVISDWFWRTWFGSRDDVIGRSYFLAGGFRTVIGVMKPDFRFPDERVAMWVPLEIRASQVSPGGFGPKAVARMKAGTDSLALASQLEPFARRVQQRLGGPAPYVRTMERHRPVVKPLRDQLAGSLKTPLSILLGTVIIVFLLACANVASLVAVRLDNRQRDLAVRRALGASQLDLIRLHLAEALLLAATGGAAGALIAWAGVPLLVSAAPDAIAGGFVNAPIPGLAVAGLNSPALLFTAGISLIAACAIGLAPLLRPSAADVPGLAQAGRGLVGFGRSTGDVLVIAQTACAVVLLIGAALLARSLWHLTQVDAGYDTDGIFTFQISASGPEFKERAAMARWHYAFMDRLNALPGVESVGFVTTLPLDEGASSVYITTPALTASGAEAPMIRYAGAGGAYFQTMGIELRSGRPFDRVEEERGLPSAIISDAAAKLLFPGEDPLNKQLRPAGAGQTWFTVVGVVENIVIDDFRRESPEPMVYLPAASGSPAYVMKSARADSLEPDVRAVLRELLPQSPMFRVFTMKRLAANAMSGLSFTMTVVALGAVLALVLAVTGLYAVMSYRVTKRTREIGVRMALGAEAKAVRWMFVRQGTGFALLGTVLGMLAGASLTKYLQTLLFGVERLDVSAFAITATIMLAVAFLACYVPSRRASRVDPTIALRSE